MDLLPAGNKELSAGASRRRIPLVAASVLVLASVVASVGCSGDSDDTPDAADTTAVSIPDEVTTTSAPAPASDLDESMCPAADQIGSLTTAPVEMQPPDLDESSLTCEYRRTAEVSSELRILVSASPDPTEARRAWDDFIRPAADEHAAGEGGSDPGVVTETDRVGEDAFFFERQPPDYAADRLTTWDLSLITGRFVVKLSLVDQPQALAPHDEDPDLLVAVAELALGVLSVG